MLKLDIDELKSINLQVNNTVLYIRKNLNADISELQRESVRINELLDLVNEINKNTPELKISVEKIRLHFQKKQKILTQIESAIKEIRTSVNDLIPSYNELEKNNISFTHEKRDFYRECLLDAYMFISFSHKENEMRIIEDQKILGQIINYANAPNPLIQKFANHIETIHKKTKEIDHHLESFKEDTINEEVKIIARYYQDSIYEQNKQNESLITFMFVAIGVYLIFMVLILRKN